LRLTLDLWAQHRQQWYAAKSSQIHEQLHGKWDKIAVRDSYREVCYRLKLQRQRWRELMQNFSDVPQGTA